MPYGDKRCTTLLYLLFIGKALSFLDVDNAAIIGLLLLIGEVNRENANSGLYVFRVLHCS